MDVFVSVITCPTGFVKYDCYMHTFRSPGRIVEAEIEDFTALAGSGQLLVIVQNTGSVTSDYAVRDREVFS